MASEQGQLRCDFTSILLEFPRILLQFCSTFPSILRSKVSMVLMDERPEHYAALKAAGVI